MAAGDITSELRTASDFKAALFDGVDDYVEIPHHASQLGANLSNGFTISAWINPKSNGEIEGSILDKSNGGNGSSGFEFAKSSVGNLIILKLNNGDLASTNTINFNNWYHSLITVSSAQLANFYINGTLSGTANKDLVQPISAITTTNAMRIGNRATATDRTFDGSIKDVKMWNRVLTTTEITEEYNGQNHTQGQILWVPLQTDYNDKSTLGLTGTNSGTILTNNLTNNLTADMKGLNLAAATDKLIVVPVKGRDQVVKIIKAERAAA